MTKKKRSPVIICTGTHGRAVVFGWIDGAIPQTGDRVVIYGARMILRWRGERGLFGVAAYGPEEGSAVTVSVEETTCEVQQALAVTIKAAEVLDAWPAE